VLTPDHPRATFDIEAKVFEGSAGVPLVIPHAVGRGGRNARSLR
jgi:hypothetical protein